MRRTSARALRLKPFVESAFGVRVEVVADHNDLGARCVTALEQPGDLLCPIAFRAAWAGRGLAPSRQRLAEHEHRRRTGTFVFVVDPARAIAGGGHRRTGLADQLYRRFVHAQHRTIAIQGPSVGLEHLLHMRRKFGVSLRRDHPVGDLALAHPVFLELYRWLDGLGDEAQGHLSNDPRKPRQRATTVTPRRRVPLDREPPARSTAPRWQRAMKGPALEFQA